MVKDLNVVREIRSLSDLLFNRIYENLSWIPEGDDWVCEWYPKGIEDDCIEKYTIKTKDVVALVEFAVKYYESYYHRNERELMDNPKCRSIVLTMVLSKVIEVVDGWRGK